jgi:hypothetical protein
MQGLRVTKLERAADHWTARVALRGITRAVDSSLTSLGPWCFTPEGFGSAREALRHRAGVTEVPTEMARELWKRVRREQRRAGKAT